MLDDRCPPIPDTEPVALPPSHARYHVRVDHGELQIITAESPTHALQQAVTFLRMFGRCDIGKHHGAVRRWCDVEWSDGAFVVERGGTVQIGAVA